VAAAAKAVHQRVAAVAGRGLGYPNGVALDLEADLGTRLDAEPLADRLRDRDLAFEVTFIASLVVDSYE
jgi:hypothetical protein